MSGRTEIEDCIAEHAWRERNQLDAMPQIGAAAVPPMEALRAQAARDYPMEYDAPPKGDHTRELVLFLALTLVVFGVMVAVEWVKGTGLLPM